MVSHEKIKEILKNCNLYDNSVKFTSCPTCGRTSVDLIPIAKEIETFCNTLNSNIKVAVMGCVVNGPGEAKEADLGIAGGIGEGLLIKKGEIIKKVPEAELLNTLKAELYKNAQATTFLHQPK